MNDEYVQLTNFKKILNEKAYILFYAQKDNMEYFSGNPLDLKKKIKTNEIIKSKSAEILEFVENNNDGKRKIQKEEKENKEKNNKYGEQLNELKNTKEFKEALVFCFLLNN